MLAGTKFCVFGPIRRNIKHQYLQKMVALRYVCGVCVCMYHIPRCGHEDINVTFVTFCNVIVQYTSKLSMIKHVYVSVVCVCKCREWVHMCIGEACAWVSEWVCMCVHVSEWCVVYQCVYKYLLKELWFVCVCIKSQCVAMSHLRRHVSVHTVTCVCISIFYA